MDSSGDASPARKVIEKETGRSWAALEQRIRADLEERGREMQNYREQMVAAADLDRALTNAVRVAARHRDGMLSVIVSKGRTALRDSPVLRRALVAQWRQLRWLSHWPGRASTSDYTPVV
jgi:hypothetical protein